MPDSYVAPLPAYAGIEDVEQPGLPVQTCAERAGRFGFVSKQMMYVQAGRMPSVALWEFKAALGRQIWECALHWGEWRARLGELRSHEHMIEQHADGKLADFFAELLHSRGDAELAVGLYGVLLPAYRAALLRYLDETNPLADAPGVRLVRHILLDLEDQAALGTGLLAALAKDDPEILREWRAHLELYLEAAGGIDGTRAERPSFELPPPRAASEFRVPQEFARDARFETIVPKLDPFPGDTLEDQLHSRMWVLGQEMTAAELCATVLYEWDDLPYEGCLDLARQCWDETRHSLFGQVSLEGEGIDFASLPQWVGYAGHTMPAAPPKRYSHLAIATEAAQMGHPGGKRTEWEWCRDAARHPLMTTFADFDWADEVNHVRFGRQWIINFYCKGNRTQAQAMADETVAERLAYYREHLAKAAQEGRAKEAFWR